MRIIHQACCFTSYCKWTLCMSFLSWMYLVLGQSNRWPKNIPCQIFPLLEAACKLIDQDIGKNEKKGALKNFFSNSMNVSCCTHHWLPQNLCNAVFSGLVDGSLFVSCVDHPFDGRNIAIGCISSQKLRTQKSMQCALIKVKIKNCWLLLLQSGLICWWQRNTLGAETEKLKHVPVHNLGLLFGCISFS